MMYFKDRQEWLAENAKALTAPHLACLASAANKALVMEAAYSLTSNRAACVLHAASDEAWNRLMDALGKCDVM